jgi:putative inorganic carbon (hco3(-)) transporter
MKEYALPTSICLLLLSMILPFEMMGLLVTVIIGVLLLANPKQGLLFLIIYFPIRPFLLELNGSLKFLGDLVVVLLFLQSLFYWIKNKHKLKRESIFIVGFLAFCLIGAVSALITGVSIMSIIFQLRAFLITFLLIFIVGSLKLTKKDVYSFLWITVIMAVIISLQGIAEKVSLRTWLLPESWVNMEISETNRMRIYGLLGNPNVLATYLSIAFVCSLYLRTIYPKYRYLLHIASILIFGVFLLTYSRGTLIAFSVGMIAYIVLSKKWEFIKPLAISVILSLPLVYYPVVTITDYIENAQTTQNQIDQGEKTEKEKKPEGNSGKKDDFSKRMTEAFDKETIQKSTEWGRLYLVKQGFEIYMDHPIIGTGFGTFGDSASLNYPSPIYKDYKITTNIYTDNQYIQVIAQTGSLGVISFAVFILGMVVAFWKKRKELNLSIPVIAFLIGGCVAGLFYNIWEDKTFTMYFYILLGYTLNRGYWEKIK